MTPQELKYSVFRFAFQGKLVPQSEEETLTDKTAFSIDDAPYDIPDSWKWNTIGECCEMYTGNSISESEKRAKYEGLQEGYDYIGTKDVSFEHVIAYNNGVRIPYKTDFKIAYKEAILMCIEGGSAGRKIAILDRDVCFGNKLCMFKTHSLLNTYLYYYLQSIEFKKAFMDNMTGIIGGVSIKRLKEIMLPIPPLAEQKRIVAKIEELLPLVDRYEQAWTKLEDFNKRFPLDMQKSILQMAIQGKLVPQDASEGTAEELYQQIQNQKNKLIKEGKIKKEKRLQEITQEEILFDIPDSWKWVRLSEVIDVRDGTHATPGYLPSGYPLITGKDFYTGVFDFSKTQYISKKDYDEIRQRSNVEVGDILFSMIGGNIGSMIKISKENFFEMAIKNVALFKQYDYQIALTDYLFIYLKSQVTRMQAIAKGGAQSFVPLNTLRSYPFPLPPLDEQKRIVKKLEEVLPLCERLKS